MTRRIIQTLALTILAVSIFLGTTHTHHTAKAAQYVALPSWTNAMNVSDVTVSSDGDYLAAVNETGLYYFNKNSSTPRWWYFPTLGTTLLSTAISSNGQYTLAGDNNGFIYYFNQSTIKTGLQVTFSWRSRDLGGPIERQTIDMSADGQSVALGGTGIGLYFFTNCTTRTGQSENYTWTNMYIVWDFLTVHLSKNGKYLAAAGTLHHNVGFVVFYNNANTAPYPTEFTWMSWSALAYRISDLEVSDDGYAVAATDMNHTRLYYWANATNLQSDVNATWTTDGAFTCVDMNTDGSKVVAGGLPATCLDFWTNARTRKGIQQSNWTKLQNSDVYDVAMDLEGNLIAAVGLEHGTDNKAYFLTSDGTTNDEHDLQQPCSIVSMSDQGSTVAVAGSGGNSLHVFTLMFDSTPPSINEVFQQPQNSEVYPYNPVSVYANIMDDLSGVKQAFLNYTTGNGTWHLTQMETTTQDIWNGTIPAFPLNTNVTYNVIAQDNANNTITSIQEGYTLEYRVIPEIPTATLAALLIVTGLVSAIVIRRKKKP